MHIFSSVRETFSKSDHALGRKASRVIVKRTETIQNISPDEWDQITSEQQKEMWEVHKHTEIRQYTAKRLRDRRRHHTEN